MLFKVNAGNDTNGNPRRGWVHHAPSGKVTFYDEGYQGSGALPPRLQKQASRAIEMRIGPGEYRRLLRECRPAKRKPRKRTSRRVDLISGPIDISGEPRRSRSLQGYKRKPRKRKTGMARTRKMSLTAFIRENREEIDAAIDRALGRKGIRTDHERRLWVVNDEGLYNWARSEGADV